MLREKLSKVEEDYNVAIKKSDNRLAEAQRKVKPS